MLVHYCCMGTFHFFLVKKIPHQIYEETTYYPYYLLRESYDRTHGLRPPKNRSIVVSV